VSIHELKMFFKPQIIKPEQGQESVWDYPRPPRLEPVSKRIKIIFNEIAIADTQNAYRVLETSHPPVYYLPPQDIEMEYLQLAEGQSFCEWKGIAGYYNIVVSDRQALKAAWFYSRPTPDFAEIKDYIAFYAHCMDACYVGDEKVTPQPGNFYGGWITKDIVGPFKGEAGSWGW
jgi:uncharacterized protein (DUF427 family)